MSVIEDSRKVIQDFVAPELRAIDTRLHALEKRMDTLETSVELRFDKVEQQVDRRFDQLLEEIREQKTVHDLELRMAMYESSMRALQADKASAQH